MQECKNRAGEKVSLCASQAPEVARDSQARSRGVISHPHSLHAGGGVGNGAGGAGSVPED